MVATTAPQQQTRSDFDAQAHDDWIRAKIARTLADQQPSVPHDEAMCRVQAVIDAKRKQHADQAAP